MSLCTPTKVKTLRIPIAEDEEAAALRPTGREVHEYQSISAVAYKLRETGTYDRLTWIAGRVPQFCSIHLAQK